MVIRAISPSPSGKIPAIAREQRTIQSTFDLVLTYVRINQILSCVRTTTP
jgi:hypothetical protein